MPTGLGSGAQFNARTLQASGISGYIAGVHLRGLHPIVVPRLSPHVNIRGSTRPGQNSVGRPPAYPARRAAQRPHGGRAAL
eukprot:11097262-Alexandrium_andersonii.AAC.1